MDAGHHSGTKRYIETMAKFHEKTDAQTDDVFLDSSWTQVTTVATNGVTNLIHLEGETVSILVDGASHPPAVVTNGMLTLSHTGYVITVGYNYNSDGRIMPVEGGSRDGPSMGKKARIFRVGMWLNDTLGLKIGPDVDNLTEVLVRQWGDEYGEPTPLYTGVVRETFEGDYTRTSQVYWRADGPFPATVMAIPYQAEVTDDT